METYILTSKIFDGEVEISVSQEKKLQADFTKSSVSVDQQRFILKKMSEGLEKMKLYFNTPPTDCKMELLVIDFDMFWNRYDDKISSSRKRAKAKWDKMSDIDRNNAYNHISKYLMNIPYGTRKKYAETFLNCELWNN